MKKNIKKQNLTVTEGEGEAVATDEALAKAAPVAGDTSAAEAVAPVPAAAVGGTDVTPKKPKDKKEGKAYRFFHSETFSGYLFVLPWLIGFCVFVAYPIIQTLIFSFGTVDIRPGEINTTFIGFENYAKALVRDGNFTKALGDYVTEMVLYVPVITVISLILAMLLNSKLKGTGFFRTIFFFPVIITSGPVIKMFVDQGVASFPGIENLIDFTALAETLPQFLVDALQFLTSEFIMILWFSGIQILVFMTGLQKMDKSMYEAAKIDGATKWEMFWKITLPALNPTIVLNVVFTVVMQSIFSLNPIITKIQTDMNATDGSGGYGYASAMAWIYFIVMLAILGLAVLIFKKHERRPKRI